MSRQMTEDWIEEEYEKFRKNEICDPLNTAEPSQYIARAFALYILKRHSQITGESS